ncbi:hypothetical protein Dthio_PD2860 [Desulfonatronospira thiodismutans ASO3-1]|uniref:Uncharacterized protein n=1 Tax=Desulfonatronospira thiodismutans ASO3-1 TaxID=555779 RepID=D6SL79_9BACT|nr:hypothetical protein Dthio_PD2860 [Desulfonatronospira thiodismutans ASO3-1]
MIIMINKNKVAVSIQGVLVFSPWHSRQKRDSGTLMLTGGKLDKGGWLIIRYLQNHTALHKTPLYFNA